MTAPQFAMLASVGDADVLAVEDQHAARFKVDHWEELTPPARTYSARSLRRARETTTATTLDRDHVLFVGGDGAKLGAEVFSAIDDEFVDAGALLTRRRMDVSSTQRFAFEMDVCSSSGAAIRRTIHRRRWRCFAMVVSSCSAAIAPHR